LTWCQLDFFQWNFYIGFIYITALIVVACSLAETIGNTSVRLVALPLPILLFTTSISMLYGSFIVSRGGRYPMRFSSMPKGALARPGIYTIIEDVVAVDGGQGSKFRKAFNERYKASLQVRTLLRQLNLYWGSSGFVVAITLIVLIAAIPNVDAALVLGRSTSGNRGVFFGLIVKMQVGSFRGYGQEY
jgi:hypothetical protein